MPRDFKSKGNRNCTYTHDDLEFVVKEIALGNLTTKQAKELYHIPKTTLYYRLSGDRSNKKPGGRTILSHEEEKFLVYTINIFQEWHRPLTKPALIDIARTYMLELHKSFSRESTLNDWYSSFMKRWKDEIKLIKATKLEKTRSEGCTQDVIGEYNLLKTREI